MKIGFIGAGRTGVSLGKYFCDHGIPVTGYYSRTPQSARDAAEFTGTMSFRDIEAITEISDTLFLTVPDRMVAELWDRIKQLPIQNKIICHCSGAFSSAVFSKIEGRRAYGYSIHPLYAFSDREQAYKGLSDVLFTIEGAEDRLPDICRLFVQLGNPFQVISAQDKAKYHAAAVFAANGMTALMQTAIRLLTDCGFSEADAQHALGPMLLHHVENIVHCGPVGAMTGPVERGDAVTVFQHLSCLCEEDKALYVLLSRRLLAVARQKNPGKRYDALEKLLGDAE